MKHTLPLTAGHPASGLVLTARDRARLVFARPLLRHVAIPIALAAPLFAEAQQPAAAVPEAPGAVQAISFLGDTLRSPALPPETRAPHAAALAEAEAGLAANPDDPDALIWVGRRAAYLGDYRGAIAVFTRGIERFPADARFLRHRGHRHISVRQLEDAVADLERAASMIRGRSDEVEPDGLPNARNIPTSTLHSNTWYHLGLAYYLQGRFEDALHAYRECLAVSRNPDMLVATSHWLYMTLRRLGRDEEAEGVLAAITPELDVIENHAYHRLLLMYKGALPLDSLVAGEPGSVDDATVGYGIGNWYLYTGDRERAAAVFRRILAGVSWAAFGYIAAEAEIARDAEATGTTQ